MPTSLNKYLDPAGLDETVVNIRELVEGLEAEMQDLPYARPNGLYPDMTVGAVIGADETAQWARRESTGSGAATVRSVQGATVVWNQLCDGISSNGNVQFNESVVTVQNHVYLFAADVTRIEGATSAGVDIYGRTVGGSVQLLARVSTQTTRASAIFTMSIGGLAGGSSHDEGHFWGYTLNTTQSASNGMLFDLTQMFGSGNEPSTVAEFESMYPADYYPYSAPTLTPVRIAGIASTDANGDALNGVEWETQTLRAADSAADMLYSDHVDVKIGVVDLGTLTWIYDTQWGCFAGNIGAVAPVAKIEFAGTCAKYPFVGSYRNLTDKTSGYIYNTYVAVKDTDFGTNVAAFKAAMSGVLLFYELATPTTTPISPALPMTYRVKQGGTESIVVPEGEISAAPVLTVAEPVNMSTELARIWAAIESLGYTRNTAQLSRPVSLTNVGSVDEVQKDTTDVVEIDTTKEVTE